jgi:pimeloyl-ACP methyl ester carboxylesterase
VTEPSAPLIGDLHVDLAGSGSSGLVLLPPNPLDSSSWLFQIAHFSAWFRTVAVDLPGYGHSPRLRGPLTMTDLADAAWAAVTRAGVDRAVIAGVSIGASLTLHMLRRQPDRAIAGLISGYGYGPDKPFAARRIAGYQEGGLEYRREHMRDGFSASYRSSEPGRFMARVAEDRASLVDVQSIVHLFGAHGEPDPDELFEAPCPVLLIVGSEDYAFERSGALHDRIVGSERVVIEGAGHACNIEQPERWNEAAIEFLQRRTTSLQAR